jgi:zinc protease
MKRYSSRILIGCLAALLLSTAIPVQALMKTPAQKAILPNGLKVIVAEDHSLPLAAVALVFNAGRDICTGEEWEILSALNRLRETADSHDGSRTELKRLLEADGCLDIFGQSPRSPLLACQGPNKSIECMFRHLKALGFRLKPSSEQIDEARRNLLNQIDQFKRHPLSSQYLGQKAERLLSGKTENELEFGNPDKVAAISPETIVETLAASYVPNNAVLVIVGDVNTSETFKQAVQIFGDLVAREVSREKEVCPLPEQGDSVRVSTEFLDIKTTQVVLSFEAPGEADPDRAAAELWLAAAAFANDSWVSRVLEKQFPRLANVRMNFHENSYGGLFSIGFESPDPNIDPVIHFILEQMSHLWMTPPSPTRIAQLIALKKNQLSMNNEQRLFQAISLGLAELLKDCSLHSGFGAALEAVNRKDMERVARRMFSPRRYAMAVAHPLTCQVRKERPLQVETLKNGLRTLVKAYQGSEVVGVCFQFNCGAPSDPADKEGVSRLLAEYLNMPDAAVGEGLTIHQRLDRIGAKSYVAWRLSSISVSAYADKKHFSQLMEILSAGIFSPKWSEELRRRAIRKLLSDRDTIDTYAGNALWEKGMAGTFDGSPLAAGFRVKDSLKDISLKDLQAFHQKWIVPEITNLAVVGNMDPEQIMPKIKENLDALLPGNFPENPKAVVDVNVPLSHVIELEASVPGSKKSGYLAVAYRLPPIPELLKSPEMDFAACMALAHVLALGANSMVQREFIDSGLALDKPIQGLTWDWGPGYLMFALEVPADRLMEMKIKLKALLESFPNRDLAAEEIKVAAKFSDAAFWMSLERSHNQAGFFASLMRLGVGADLLESIAVQFRALTPEMAKKVAGRFFRNFVLITGKTS